MKIIARIAVILLAALLVVGVTLVFSQSGLAASIGVLNGHGALAQGKYTARVESDQSGSNSGLRGDFERDGRFNIQGTQPMVKNFGIIAGVIVVVAGIGFVLKVSRKRKVNPLPTSRACRGGAGTNANRGEVGTIVT